MTTFFIGMSRTFTSNPRTLAQQRLHPTSTEIAESESNIHTIRDFDDSARGGPVDDSTPHRNNPRQPNSRGRGRRGGPSRQPNRRNSPPPRVPLPRPPLPASLNSNPNEFARASDNVHQLARDSDQYNANSEDSGEPSESQNPSGHDSNDRPTPNRRAQRSHMNNSFHGSQFQQAGQSPNAQQHRSPRQSIEERAA